MFTSEINKILFLTFGKWYTKKLFIAICVFLIMIFLKNIRNRKNQGAIVIIPSGLGIFHSQNTKDSKNHMKLQYRL